ncbi:MAG: HAD-IIA family hydrolase [Lachnospiraceae bacterium]|nr:HAD-IIA family hydrolase [Lachnospiraceae bacterium]
MDFINDITKLNQTELFVLDMDGTFYLSDDIIEGSLEFLEKVRNTGRRFLFFTNNSSKDKKLYITKLAKMNCFIGPEDIYTSGDVTISYLKKHYPDRSVFLLGTPPLVESFAKAGIFLKQDMNDTADIVVVGFDMTLTYDKLEHACTLIRNGATFIATHPDINCPVTGGFIPDCGAFIAAISLSTGVSPLILGKPYVQTADMIELMSGVPKARTAFVGDRLYTDVACGVKNGAMGILVLSGECSFEDIEKSDVKPDFVFDRLYDIGKALK